MASRVADILLEEARQQAEGARERGAIWGNTIQQLGQIPGQVIAADQQAKDREALRQERQQSMQLTGMKVQQMKDQMQAKQNVDAMLKSPELQPDPTTGKIDEAKAMGAFTKMGAPLEEVQRAMTMVRGNNDAVEKGIEEKQIRMGRVAHMALSASPMDQTQPIEPHALEFALQTGVQRGDITAQEADQLRQTPPEERRGKLHALRASSKEFAKLYEPAQRKAGEQTMIPATGQVIGQTPEKANWQSKDDLEQFDPATGAKVPGIVEHNPNETDATKAFRVGGQFVPTERIRKAPPAEKPTNQNTLEQEYRAVLSRSLLNRASPLGVEHTKVNTAIHLNQLFEQYYDPKTKRYNIPEIAQEDLAMGMATMLSPNGRPGPQMVELLSQPTAFGKLQGILSFVTGKPQVANTQEVFRMYKDIIERQGEQAEENRDQEMDVVRGLAPTQLEESRRLALERQQLPSFKNRKRAGAPAEAAPKAAPPAAGATGRTVKMTAPDGGELDVPEAEVAAAERLGAKRR